jgi:hypothetical protein
MSRRQRYDEWLSQPTLPVANVTYSGQLGLETHVNFTFVGHDIKRQREAEIHFIIANHEHRKRQTDAAVAELRETLNRVNSASNPDPLLTISLEANINAFELWKCRCDVLLNSMRQEGRMSKVGGMGGSV